jgi:magnesium and cobalt transporter
MSEPPSSRPATPLKHRSLLERLGARLFREPENRQQLLDYLHEACERNLLDLDAVSMIEGVLQVSELRAGDLMVPRSQMDVVDIAQDPQQWIPFVIATAHSRFPVIDGDRDQVIGLLLAKDLLRCYHDRNWDVRAMLRPAFFVPESKPLNILLREFRASRNHMAIVVDEYGGVAGLITIEDVLEQIVGDIEDEYDLDEGGSGIVAEPDGRYRVRALTPVEAFNEAFGTTLADREFDTIGGFVTRELGRVPRRGDSVEIDGLRIEVLRADERHAQLLQVTRLARTVAHEFAELEAAQRRAAA